MYATYFDAVPARRHVTASHLPRKWMPCILRAGP